MLMLRSPWGVFWEIRFSDYDGPRPAFLLAGLPAEVLGRLRSDRVTRRVAPARIYDPEGGARASTAGVNDLFSRDDGRRD